MIFRELKRGKRTLGALLYLYGPGKANEHTNPHLVGAWSDHVKDPARSSESSLEHLAMLLDMPVHAMRAKKLDQHVWHGVIALPDGDRQLTDAEWKEITAQAVQAAGLTDGPDDPGCRWVAIRHADDHVHILATLARQDGTRATSGDRMKNNWLRMQEAAAEWEIRYGLQQTPKAERTAKKRPTRGEVEKAQRNARPETPRETLQAKVRQAAAVARSDDEFFAALQKAGLRVQRRVAPDGRTTGYSVALPGDRTASGRAVWFSGSKLSPDLSLPRVRERWGETTPRAAGTQEPAVASRAEAWQRAAEHVHQAAALLGRQGQEAAAGELAALSDFLTTYATDAPLAVRDEIKAAAVAFERAGRAPTSRRLDSEASRHFQSATRLIVGGAAAVAGGGEAAAAVALLAAAALAIIAAIRWHQARRFAAQEQAARAAAVHLRAATEIAYGATSGRGRGGGSMWHRTAMQPAGPELTAHYEQAVRAALPQHAGTIVTEAAWPALAATLRTLENAGYAPVDVLSQVSRARGFGDADSISEVLVWRLQRRMEQDARTGRLPQAAATAAAAGTGKDDASPARPTLPGQSTGQPAETMPGHPPMPPVTRGQQRGPADPDTRLGDADDALTLAETVHQAVPEHAAAVLADPASAALAATLATAAGQGYRPAELLAQVAAVRELDSADSVAEILTWRAQGRMRRDQQPAPRTRTAQARTTPPKSPAPRRTLGEQSPAQRAAQQAAQQRNQPRRHGR
ncbi:relaxase/mobilization nuclease domain-containing protein [Kitasatospora sp. NPDC001660]